MSVKWLMNCCINLRLSNDVFFKAARFLDIVLCASPLTLSEVRYHLACCLWLALKLEHGNIDFLSSFSEEDEKQRIINSEPVILKLLGYRLDYNTVVFFLNRLIEALECDSALTTIAFFFSDVSSLMVSMMDFPPYVISAAAICLAKVSSGNVCPTQRVLEYSHLDDVNEVKVCAQMILSEAFDVYHKKEDTIYEKYASRQDVVNIKTLNLNSSIINNI